MGIKEAEEPNVEGRLPLLPYLPQTFLKCSRSPSSKVRFFESPQEKNALSFAIPSCAFLNRNRPRQSIFSGKLANHVRNHFQFRPILPRKKQLFHAVLNLESRSSTRQVPLLLQGGGVLKRKEGAGLFHPGLPRSTMENCAKIGPNRNAKRGKAVKRKPSSVTVRIVECCISFSIVLEQL